nr:oxygen-dependent choline dehydrogenase [Quercus suber]
MAETTTTSATYVIVGGGTAGLVVANRLTEDPNVHVLVLEAGQNHLEDPRVNIPAFFTTLMGSEADFQYHTTSQATLNGREVKEPQGKLLGGSSGVNGQAFIAPSKADIDAWAKIGNSGWDWDSVSPYIRKFYTLTTPDQATLEHLGIDWLDEDTRGTDGPIQVSFPGVIQNPMGKAWIDAFKAMDYHITSDPFSGKSIGGYSNAATVDFTSKTRSYSATAYGAPALQRSNFHLVTGATAQKIILETTSSGVIAKGVQALVNGERKTFNASKEVILAAGVFNTPKLLELSGIGNKTILEKHGIEVAINNPGVGENLQDHLMTGISFEVVDGVITGDPLMRQEPEALQAAQQLYAEHKAGPFTMGGMQSHAFMPMLEFAGTAGEQAQKELLDKYTPQNHDEYYNIVRSIIESPDEGSGAWFMFLAQANLHEHGKSFVGTQLQPENFASLGCSQCHPFSRGSTHIASSDVNAMPDIDPKYFSHPADLEIFARHVQSMEKLRHQPELAKFFKPDGKRNHPDAFGIHTLEGAKKYVRDTALTTYHGCGSAAMLPKEKGGVVDEKLKVYGTSNLRIVDASIFPLIPRNNIMSTVYAVAEKAADIIKGC